jgi:hypothetical protein
VGAVRQLRLAAGPCAGAPLHVSVLWDARPGLRLGWRLLREPDGLVGEGRFDAEAPGEVLARLEVPVPPGRGRLHLHVAPVEEGVRWLHDDAAELLLQV